MHKPFRILLWMRKLPSDMVHPSFVITDVHPSKASVLSAIRPHLSFGTWRMLLRTRSLRLGSVISTCPTPIARRPLPMLLQTCGRCQQLSLEPTDWSRGVVESWSHCYKRVVYVSNCH